MDRIESITSLIDKCKVFADVGCDHGYCAEYALKEGLCERAIISDISAKSLSKAETLLKNYISDGRCVPVCCDGLLGIKDVPDLVLIAGMGGEEIIKILNESYIPQNFIFQPMKNAANLRRFLLLNGCSFSVDDIFSDGDNYYFIIKGRRAKSGQNYSRTQLEFGRDSLLNPVFRRYAETEIQKKQTYLKACPTPAAGKKLSEDIKILKEALGCEG